MDVAARAGIAVIGWHVSLEEERRTGAQRIRAELRHEEESRTQRGLAEGESSRSWTQKKRAE